MKLTKQKLKQIIKEELNKVLREDEDKFKAGYYLVDEYTGEVKQGAGPYETEEAAEADKFKQHAADYIVKHLDTAPKKEKEYDPSDYYQ